MRIDALRQVTNFVQPITSKPANIPQEGTGEIPPNDNLKHENVQVTIRLTAPDIVETPPGQKMRFDYLA